MKEDTINPFSNLTKSQRQVAAELMRGFSNQEIADLLGLKVTYVNKVVSAIYAAACIGKGVSNKRDKLIMVLLTYEQAST